MKFNPSIFELIRKDEAVKASQREAVNVERLKRENAGLKAWNTRMTNLLIRRIKA
jgi:cell fate (sporulation/competence/biofilm development) regulator YmcA (YheA/YmcA/DUF963 family)